MPWQQRNVTIKQTMAQGKRVYITETSNDAWVDILFRPLLIFTSLSCDAGWINAFPAKLNRQIKPHLLLSRHSLELGCATTPPPSPPTFPNLGQGFLRKYSILRTNFTQRGSEGKLLTTFFIPLFSCYSPLVINLSFSAAERSVKVRKQNNHR